VAFNNCSQGGLLVIAVGLSKTGPALYHLVKHAGLKALIFLDAGSVNHAMADQQDLRRLGGLWFLLPFTYKALFVGSLSLFFVATPFLSGFYSKDAVLEAAAGAYSASGATVYKLGTRGATLTAFYSMRLLALNLFTMPNTPEQYYLSVLEAPLLLGIPLVFLGVASEIGGWFLLFFVVFFVYSDYYSYISL
jgi:NADH-ubiquinone oxidoreductase chain 5